MNNKNDIEIIKEAIKEVIYLKSIKVYKIICNSEDERYQRILDSGKLNHFSLSTNEIRKADKLRIINGKRNWLYKYAIQELIDDGSVIVSNSYCNAVQNKFCKAYALKLNKLHEVMKYLDVEINIIRKNTLPEWNPDMPFVEDSFDGYMTMDKSYTPSELKKAEKEWNNAKKYAEFCRSKRADMELKYIQRDWIEHGDMWPALFNNAVKQYTKEKKYGTETVN